MRERIQVPEIDPWEGDIVGSAMKTTLGIDYDLPLPAWEHEEASVQKYLQHEPLPPWRRVTHSSQEVQTEVTGQELLDMKERLKRQEEVMECLARSLLSILPTWEALRNEAKLTLLCPSDGVQLSFMVATNEEKFDTMKTLLPRMTALKDWLVEWQEIKTHLEKYLWYLNHRDTYLKSCFNEYELWPFQTQVAADPKTHPGCYNWSDRWSMSLRTFHEWCEDGRFVHSICTEQDTGHVVLQPPEGRTVTSTTKSDEHKGNPPWSRTFNGTEQFLLQGFEIGGPSAKHRFIPRPPVMYTNTKLASVEDPMENLRNHVDNWMKFVVTHEVQLGDQDRDEVFIYVQDPDRRQQYKAKKNKGMTGSETSSKRQHRQDDNWADDWQGDHRASSWRWE